MRGGSHALGSPPAAIVARTWLAEMSRIVVLSWRLAELLPLAAETKQSLLQMQQPRERLVEIRRLVAKLRG